MTGTERSGSGLRLRPMGPGEAPAALRLHLAARRAATARRTMPAPAHPSGDAWRWFSNEVVGRREIWVADVDAEIAGMLVLDTRFLDQLYVTPAHQGRGIGSALLQLAFALRPDGFGLWVFEANVPAIRLYERHGLRLVECTDGAGNDERAPDRRYRWDGARARSRT